jgi:KaiC/GvpD/RAD55 family RecA-like ATPase
MKLDLSGVDNQLQGVIGNNVLVFGGNVPLEPDHKVALPPYDLVNNKNLESINTATTDTVTISDITDNSEPVKMIIPTAEYQDECDYDIRLFENLSVGGLGYLHKLCRRLQDRPAKVPFGVSALDEVTGGLSLSASIVTVAASPNVGKTTILVQSASEMAKQGIMVVYLSFDMRETDIVAKVISHISYELYGEDCYTLNDILDKNILNDGSEKSIKVLEKVAKTQRYLAVRDLIYDPEFDAYCNSISGMSELNRIQRIFHLYCSIYKKVVFIVDSLQQVAPSQKGNSMDSVDRQLREFKELSTVYDVPIILISTINRSSYSSNKDLDMTALKHSGSIEFDSDVVIILQPAFIKEGKEISMDDFRASDYRDITVKNIKSRTCGYKEVTATLFAPGCTFIECKERDSSKKAIPKAKVSTETGRKPNNHGFV